MRQSAILLINCPDAKGLVASVSGFLYEHGANILSADEHRDDASERFFMRIEWDVADFRLDPAAFPAAFESQVARRFGMDWRVEYSQRPMRVAVFVSKYLHCLADLLYRHQTGELAADIRLIVSNHEDARRHAEFHGIPFEYVPVGPGGKAEAEARALKLLDEQEIDLVVLARYMQVLSPEFVERYEGRVINVHHSFLPAFSGAKPYHAAFARGVKLIGATAHYVTEILDDGPIIDQEVIRVSHRDQLEELIQKGRDAERMVLSRAVRWHLEHRVLLCGRKTVVFE
ncbi:formyltetrahydrofolate deformylase [Paludibaculum fermentans]|uniref:Formyltetrahydrofolate deformylase n=1 Tax=Paludibaculum fermentans TaxID=1473598 RepID=A0A7S7SJ96_PALFE|nr:formyltetrahydrofolate deformylase [Paludibaculum fermentans]QOY85765.1 formyltetrahydrofolate deformylase [Paludibaculum fermentans]